ncbi:MAG: hypothetical protein AAB534_02800 [Patescibacteria group bacterium]
MTKESTSLIVIGLVILIGIFIHFFNPSSLPKPTTVCPSDLKICPDGSYVGRGLPSCNFLECAAKTEESNAATTQ